ncbi:hypothetical protein ACTFIV_009587 [Dictyostelium citrinum]
MKLKSIFLNLSLSFIVLISGLKPTFGQSCPAGYTWNAGSNNCHSGGSLLISSSYCDLNGVRGVYLGTAAASNCPSGWKLLTWNWQYVSNNQITMNNCGMNGPQDYSLFSSVGLGCGAGASGYYSQLVTFDNTNRYFIATHCDAPLAPYTIMETNSKPTTTESSISTCISSPGSKIGPVTTWDYGLSVCQNGYTNFPACSTDINECLAGTHQCISPATCSNTVGSYTCNCPTGYTKNSNGYSCTDIDECTTKTSGCEQKCTNTVGSFICSCLSGYTINVSNSKKCDDVNECLAGTHQCISPATCSNTVGSYTCNCPTGYTKNSNGYSCTDIDECTTKTSGCEQKCTNTVGSFICSCLSGYTINVSDSKKCDDVNECLAGTHQCISPATCSNTVGSYTCNCPTGYTKNSNGYSCTDIDECTTKTSGCEQKCTNTVGSFICSCLSGYTINVSDSKKCDDVNECLKNSCGTPSDLLKCTNSPGNYSCSCSEGYQYSVVTKSCIDVDECSLGKDECTGVSNCVNQIGSYICTCPSGYRSSLNGFDCLDIDECSSPDLNQCVGVAKCSNLIGSYQCLCPNGYKRDSKNAMSCDDIDECNQLPSSCQGNAICHNSIGSFSCSCPLGYELTLNKTSCQDIDECLTNPCGQSNCNNIGGSYFCSCGLGFKLSDDNQDCLDVDECKEVENSCQGNAICHNSIGSFSCSCPLGYELTLNKTSCQDIDECAMNSTNQCKGVATCSNLIGSYDCKCPSIGYKLSDNGMSCDDIDECAQSPNSCQGNAICHNSIGSFNCSCPLGYELTLNKTSCQDIDECDQLPNSCQGNAICHNSIGSFSCSCPLGYELTLNKTSCQDIDECAINSTNQCSGIATCSNLIGSYECNCPIGYLLSNDSMSCEDIDECQNDRDNQCVGEFTICENIQGGYTCTCPTGFISISKDNGNCQDIDECQNAGENLCSSNTTCLNNNGSYTCQCKPNYSHLSPYSCQPKPIITDFYQKPKSFYTFIVKGFNFNQESIITLENDDKEFNNCRYQSGTENEIECSTREGLEVRGKVTVETNSLISEPFKFIGAPFILSYSKYPSTSGDDQVTLFGRNLPIGPNVKITVQSKPAFIISEANDEQQQQIIIQVPEGSGGFNYVLLENETVSNTDAMYISYASPFISSTSSVYQSGGILTINGRNFGLPSSDATVEIGSHQCHNVKIISHQQLICELEGVDKIYSQIINLVVDGLSVENVYYFTYSTLETDNCPEDCNYPRGKCTSFGCQCLDGFTGISCNETSGEIIPTFPPPNPETPSIGVDNGGENNGFGYKISIIRIEELDFNNVVVEGSSIPLLDAMWNSNPSNDPANQHWKFNITLENKSYLEATFEYFKQSRNITFASNSFIIPAESLKLSFTTRQWPFISKLNSLRVVIKTDTIIKNGSGVSKCSISNSVTTTYNQHVWSTTENSESGIVARFVSLAELDSTFSITANIEDLSDSNNKKTSIIGISVPYFSKQSVIDPDFGMLLNVDKKETGDCPAEDKVNWKLATGVSIGASAAVCLLVTSVLIYRNKKKDKKLKDSLNTK